MSVTLQKRRNPFADISTIELADHLGWICQNCGLHCASRGGPEANHCLVHDRKRYHRQVTIYMNKELVCHICHQEGEVHTIQHRLEFYRKRCEQYGRDVVDGWLKGLPIAYAEISVFLLDE